jgi:hypothetical protein
VGVCADRNKVGGIDPKTAGYSENGAFSLIRVDKPVKRLISDGCVKSAEIKACESRGTRRTDGYAAVTRDAA